MTRTQKILIVLSSLTISVLVGGALYLYFNRKNVLDKLEKGEPVIFTTTEILNDEYGKKEYRLMVDFNSSHEKDRLYALSTNGDNDEVVGYFFLNDDLVFFNADDKENKDSQKEITDKKEAKFIKSILDGLEKMIDSKKEDNV